MDTGYITGTSSSHSPLDLNFEWQFASGGS